jgi:hypothetical protein
MKAARRERWQSELRFDLLRVLHRDKLEGFESTAAHTFAVLCRH